MMCEAPCIWIDIGQVFFIIVGLAYVWYEVKTWQRFAESETSCTQSRAEEE